MSDRNAKDRPPVKTPRDIIRHEERYYILATSPFADDRTRVLKRGETFALFDRYGDILPLGRGEQGLYHQGTRFLSQSTLTIDGRRPLLLSSTVVENNDLVAVDLTNPDMTNRSIEGRDGLVPHGTIHLFRSRFLWNGVLYERFRMTSFADRPIEVPMAVDFGADFTDIFEVRGVRRPNRGRLTEPRVDGPRVFIGYEGLDGVLRQTVVEFDPQPDRLSGLEAGYVLQFSPGETKELHVTTTCRVGAEVTRSPTYGQAFTESEAALAAARRGECVLYSSNEQFNNWAARSGSDLLMLETQMPTGPYPYAGVPWFSTAFGRDGIITALQMLWIRPELARGVLSFLAATQATEADPVRDAEPGKILHETRLGEMAALEEIPFGRYYGTVDATPLFVMLAGAYYERTGDVAFIERIWPAIQLALQWMDRYADRDGDGFIEYARQTESGLANQGWKDSADSVMHADGRLAEGPIALCEVQGYAYQARLQGSLLAQVKGDTALAKGLARQAQALREQFEDRFWCPDIHAYALALDGKKRPCRVVSSNAGQCLFTGIADPERAAQLSRTLLDPGMFSGWGVRTLARTELRYNPMSYHNGSIWPHDNALIAAGLARYGRMDGAARVAAGLFDASLFVDMQRMPELFCGFVRRRGEGPTLYPVACSPQAWAAGTPFSLLQSMLGLNIDAPQRRINLSHPYLPSFLRWLDIDGLQVGQAEVRLRLERHHDDVGVRVMRRTGDVEISVLK